MRKVLLFVFVLFVTTGLYAQVSAGNDTCVNEKEGILLWPSASSSLRSSFLDGIKEIMADSYAGGSGTESDPYLIETKEQFARFCYEASDEAKSWKKKLEGVHFKQTKDIDLKDLNLAVGNGCYFAGIYDGNNQAIQNYTAVRKSLSEQQVDAGKRFGRALFLNVDGATIKNVRMKDCHIDIAAESDTLYVSIAGLATNPLNSQILNCTADGSYSLKVIGDASWARIGGLVAYSKNNVIDNCQSIQDIYCEIVSISGKSYADAGGIVGEAYNTKFINCTSKGDVVSYGKGDADILIARAAGIAAWADNCQILNCGNKSGLLSTKVENDQEGGLAYAQTGGIASCMVGGIADNCWTIAPMKCEGYNAQVSGATPIAYLRNNTVIRSCHYQEDNLKSLRADTEGITGHTAEFMKSQAFIDLLNAHLPEGGREWKKGTGGYPGILAVHNVTLPVLTGATTTPGSGTHEVEEGEHFRFTLLLDEEYNQSKPVVTTHTGETLEPDANMNYVTDVVTKDLTIQISGIVKNPGTANEEITRTPRVYATDNILYIRPDTPMLVEIFNIQGQKVKATMISGDTRMQLPQGFYLVRMGERAYKINISK